MSCLFAIIRESPTKVDWKQIPGVYPVHAEYGFGTNFTDCLERLKKGALTSSNDLTISDLIPNVRKELRVFLEFKDNKESTIQQLENYLKRYFKDNISFHDDVEFGKDSRSDKILHHMYHVLYEPFLSPLKDKHSAAVIEIGMDEGHSVSLWKNFFPSYHLYGVDINTCELKDHKDFTFIQADQSIPVDLDRLKSLVKKNVYVINDDGSHIPEHQLLTFNKLFPLLQRGGVYIIEDVETSYWTRGGLYGYTTRYGKCHPISIVNIFKTAIHCSVNREFCKDVPPSKVQHRNDIESITFVRNAIIIKKGGFTDRNYRFQDRL